MGKKSLPLVVILIICELFAGYLPTKAMANERRLEIPSYGKVYYWQLKTWKMNEKICDIYVEEKGLPDQKDIEAYCGSDAYQEYLTTQPCTTVLETGMTETCEGSFLVNFGQYETSYTKMVPLPKSEALYEITNCQLGEWCTEKPIIRFYGVEPLPEYEIDSVHVQVGTRHVTCDRSDCLFSIPITDDQGLWLDYWVISSYGDESPHSSVHLRNTHKKADGKNQYLVEIVSTDHADSPAAITWDSFPTTANPDAILYAQPENPESLNTNLHLYYLAGRLIFTGKVDAWQCANRGLLDNGWADTCGEEQAFDAAVAWQNQDNETIYQAATLNEIPAKLLKGLIAQESQFWPDPQILYEYGLGSLSQNGVDMLLTVDEATFLDVCLDNFSEEGCSAGYSSLSDVQQGYLRGIILRAVGTDEEINLLARILHASAIQTGNIVESVTGLPAGESATYEDLWDFSIANYYVGAGCLQEGLKTLSDSGANLRYANYCTLSSETCPSACPYVDQVKDYAR